MKKREVRRRKKAHHNVGGWAKRQQARAASHKSGRKGRRNPLRTRGYTR